MGGGYGLSVRRLKNGHRIAQAQAEAGTPEDAQGMFVQFMPPTPITSAPMHGVSISFPDGVNLTLREYTPEGIVTLLDTYARRISAREAGCSR